MSAHSVQPWQKRSFWIFLAGLLILGGVAFPLVRNGLIARREAQEQAALPPPRQVKVAALGRVEPASRVIDVAASNTGRLGALLVTDGENVAVGQVLAYMDTYAVQKAERDYAASQLAEARAELAAKTELGNSQVAEANTRLSQIDAPQQAAIQAQEAAIQSLQAELDVATIDLARFQQLKSVRCGFAPRARSPTGHRQPPAGRPGKC